MLEDCPESLKVLSAFFANVIKPFSTNGGVTVNEPTISFGQTLALYIHAGNVS